MNINAGSHSSDTDDEKLEATMMTERTPLNKRSATHRAKMGSQSERMLDAEYKSFMSELATRGEDSLGRLSGPATIWGIRVQNGIRWWNLLSIPLVSFAVILIQVQWNAQLIFLLQNEDYFNIPKANVGKVSTQLILWSYPVGAVGCVIVGYIFDICGRKLTLSVAVFL